MGDHAWIRAYHDESQSGLAATSGSRCDEASSRLVNAAACSCCPAFRGSLRAASRTTRASRDGRQPHDGRASRHPRHGARIRPLFDRFRFRQVSWASLGQSVQIEIRRKPARHLPTAVHNASSITGDKARRSSERRVGKYKATVTVTTTDTCCHAGALKVGLPPYTEGTGLVDFTHEGTEGGHVVRAVAKSIMVKVPSVKRSIAAYAVVNGQVAGEASAASPKKVAHAAK